ncbi:exodeoxyribonuclease VII, large subunit [Eubacterium saphenum ATCC 49989]|nr:exodeoxyribonuclease VII, large subunit [Eubacterium saphenum ATCC 49989]
MVPLTVTHLVEYIKDKFKKDLFLWEISVKGQISNFKYDPRKNYAFFSLKDIGASIDCVYFDVHDIDSNALDVEDEEVEITGRLDVYQKTGRMQLYVERLKRCGESEKAKQLEMLRQKLEGEGLFDKEKKRHIPLYATKIGIITGKDSAAQADIKKVIEKKNPYINTVIEEAYVQGDEAITSICRAFDVFEGMDEPPEIIVLARGGGAKTDLDAFNTEEVARRVFASNIPVVTGVGHEIDVTLADMAADQRESTPTAAADRAAFDWDQLSAELLGIHLRLKSVLERKTETCGNRLLQKFLNIEKKANIGMRISKMENTVEALWGVANASMQMKLTNLKNEIAKMNQSLENNDISKNLAKGYALPLVNGKVITTAAELRRQESFELLMKDGKVDCEITAL